MVRVDELVKAVDNFTVFHLDRPDFDNRIVNRRQTGRFNVENDKFLVFILHAGGV